MGLLASQEYTYYTFSWQFPYADISLYNTNFRLDMKCILRELKL